MDKIEATYVYLKDNSSGSNDRKLSDETSPECCLNQDLVKLIDMIKKHKGAEPDYEMVLLLSFCTYLVLFLETLGQLVATKKVETATLKTELVKKSRRKSSWLFSDFSFIVKFSHILTFLHPP